MTSLRRGETLRTGLMITKRLSLDIVLYLQKKGFSTDEIAGAMGVPPRTVKKIIKYQARFAPENIAFYLKFANISITEFLWEAIPLDHLPEKVKNNVLLCKQLSKYIHKKSEKTLESGNNL